MFISLWGLLIGESSYGIGRFPIEGNKFPYGKKDIAMIMVRIINLNNENMSTSVACFKLVFE